MSKATKITSTYLADHLSDLLSQVHSQGIRFTIEHNGQAFASLGPINPAQPLHIEDWLIKLRRMEPAGQGFAEDLEEVAAAGFGQELPDWPS